MARKRKGPGPAAVLGGMLAGFDQQVFRTTPPAHELVHHARPDDPVPTKDGGVLVIGFPDLSIPVKVTDDPGSPDRRPAGGSEAQAGASSPPDSRR